MAIVADIMTRDLISIGMDDSVRRVREMFHLHGFHHLLVMNRRKLVGIISDRDLLRNVSPFVDKLAERPQDVALLERRVHQIMSRQPIVVGANMALADAAAVMLEKKVSCLPVVNDDGTVVGVVTWRDMLRGLIQCESVCSEAQEPPQPPPQQD